MNKEIKYKSNLTTPSGGWREKHLIVKVCGMGDEARMQQMASMEIDLLGFIFYPKSPRYVCGKIKPEAIENLPASIVKVGVFVNASKEEILQNARIFHLNAVQLHGSETPELCRELKAEGFQIFKAFNLNKENNFKAYSPYCDYFLFDTPSEKHGGTGQKFDWSMLNNYTESTPFLLSGGIGPDDAHEILEINHPQLKGIDINSKFEIEPGIKNVEMIKKFLQCFPPNPLKGEQDNAPDESKMHYGAAPILYGFAKQMRINPTDAEDFLWKQLSENKYKKWRFRRQHPILYFIADFYCHKAKLIIEVDGGYHNIPQQHEYDINRDQELVELGLKVIRFTNEEVLFDIDNTLKTIEETINHKIDEQ